VQLEELEDVAADAAAEAVKEPRFGIDVKRRRLLAVKRTEPFVGFPARFSGRTPDDLHDVRLQAEVVDEALGKQCIAIAIGIGDCDWVRQRHSSIISLQSHATSQFRSLLSSTTVPPSACSGARANSRRAGAVAENPASARLSCPVP
jgi:hypothetical protein